MAETSLNRDDAFLILNALPRIGWLTLKKLMKGFNNDPVAILSANKENLVAISGISDTLSDTVIHWQKHFSLERERAILKKLGAEFVSFENDAYPALLKTIYDPPIGLYFYGPLRPSTHTVALIGSRRASLYGMSVAEKLASELAERGLCVLSGFARGIDSAVHCGALRVGGKTAGVLGCSIDRIYPPENADLYSQLRKHGSLISEFRLGTRADRMSFPRRNRILSGMSQAVIVVESDAEGGSMITAEFALEHNRQVFAIPGRIDSEMSRGCHALIRSGAILASSAEDIIEDLHTAPPVGFKLELEGQIRDLRSETEDSLDADEKTVFERIKYQGPLASSHLAELVSLPIPQLQAVLLKLELNHHISKRKDGLFECKFH